VSPRLDAFVDRILRNRRPRRFPADDEEARLMLTAAALKAGQPGADAPRPEFVEKLERMLRREVENEAARSRTPLITRRRLLGGAAAGAAAVAAGAGLDRLVDRAVESGAPATTAELVPHTGRWIDVAAVEEVPVGRPLRFSAGAIEGFVVNHGDRIQAVSAMCTHMPCSLVANPTEQRLDCPCHGAWFDLDGRPMPGSYQDGLRPLPAVRTRVVGGRVQVFGA
jgi:nitrite reductase/ring-hydroxylating ferredoxin subunit